MYPYLIALTGCLFLGVVALGVAKWALSIEHPPAKADVIVILGGGVEDRALLAAKLFNAGWAPRIFITGTGDGEGNRQLLLKHGVPASVIELEDASMTTKENAEFTIPHLRKAGVKKVLMVTTWFHSRRALSSFRFFAPDLEFVSVPTNYHLINGWRPDRYALPRVFKEYVKICWYAVRYGIWPI